MLDAYVQPTFQSAYTGGPATVEDVLAFHRSTFGDARMDANEGATIHVSTTPPADDPSGEPQAGVEAQLGEAGKRALQAERHARALAERQLAEAQQKVKEFEQNSLTAQERAERERDEFKASAESAALDLAKYEAAAKMGLPLTWAKRLVGSNPAELEADAAAIKADLDQRAKPGTPRPDPSAGQSGGGAKPNLVEAMDAYAASRQARRFTTKTS